MAKNSNKKARRTRSKQKAAKQREAVAKQTRRDKYDEELRKDRMVRSNFCSLLRDACYNPDHYYYHEDFRGTSIVSVASTIREKKLGSNEKSSLSKLIEVCKRSKLLNEKNCQRYVIGLINLAKWSWMWHNNPDFWHPSSKNTDRQFNSLVKFVLCRYDVPSFMDKVWYKSDNQNDLFQEWYINLGNGENIRKQKGLPIELTKKMAHYFSQANESFEIMEAVRWCQVRGLGGDKRTAMAVLATPLRSSFANNDFWTSVIRFFINNPMLDTYQYGPIYDYIYDQKYRDRGHVYVDNELVHLGPPQPNFSMHRRDPNALMRNMEHWHRNIRRERTRYGYRRHDCEWDTCGIPGFLKKGKKESIVIEEITTSRDLYAEGEAMKHCVGSYVTSCMDHRSAIYSLRRVWDGGFEREATIEVNIANKIITQARKSCNRPLTESDWSFVRQWANNTDMEQSSWLRY